MAEKINNFKNNICLQQALKTLTTVKWKYLFSTKKHKDVFKTFFHQSKMTRNHQRKGVHNAYNRI